jgi:serine/threonine protein phosphatase PrpC
MHGRLSLSADCQVQVIFETERAPLVRDTIITGEGDRGKEVVKMLSLRRRGRKAQNDVIRDAHAQAPKTKVMPERMAALTDRGLKRPTNQDRVLAQELPGESILLAVADGVGGIEGGETASAEAIDALLTELANARDDDPSAALARAFSAANERVRARAVERPELERMASTLAAALVRGNTAWTANAGDSRVYLFHQAQLQQLTMDHTWVAEQLRAGRLTDEEAKRSAFRNVITRGIGIADAVEPDIVGPATLEKGDVLLLCSDGLYRMVSDAAIARVLESGTPHSMAERLIRLANEAGGSDNISVVVFHTDS